jgi:hypothetical protein
VILLTSDHRLRFDFLIDMQFAADIDYQPLNCAGKRPGILAWKSPVIGSPLACPMVNPPPTSENLPGCVFIYIPPTIS